MKVGVLVLILLMGLGLSLISSEIRYFLVTLFFVVSTSVVATVERRSKERTEKRLRARIEEANKS